MSADSGVIKGVTKQVKSKQRVADHGEVFTNEREVKAMCDLVAQECNRIDSRFLEPACGNGNFLAEILTRKLATAKRLYKSNPYDFDRYSVLAVSKGVPQKGQPLYLSNGKVLSGIICPHGSFTSFFI